MKRSLIAVLMVAVLLFAFAGVAGASEDVAAKRLMSLDVVTGDPDGNLRLDDGITRAEFAAIVVRLRGMEGAANSAKGTTQFPDVKANAWYTGYINLASGNGIIKGDPQGTFRPNDEVNYAEAAAMLVRVLGYEPAVQAASTGWPNNYLSKAAELGVLDGVDMDNWKAAARRGDVFLMADNALDVDIMEQQSYGDEVSYEESDDTILTKYLDVDKIDPDDYDDDEDKPVVKETPRFDIDGLDDNEVVLGGDVKGTYEVADWINADDFLGQTVEVWINDDDVVIYMEADDDEEVIVDKVDGDISGDEISLDDDGGDYEVLDDARIYVNNEYYEGEDFLEEFDGRLDGAWVRVVLNDDDEVVFADIKDYSGDLLAETYVVDKVDADDEEIDVFTTSGKEDTVDLEDEDYKIVLDGSYVGLEDIESGNLLVVMENDNGEFYLEVSADAVVEGEVEDYDKEKRDSEASDLSDVTLEIDGEDYDLAAQVLFTDDNFETVDDLERDEVSDLVGNEVVAYVNPLGDIVAIASDEGVSGENEYGAIVSAATPEYRGDDYTISIMNSEGETLDFTFDPGDVELTYYVDGEKETVDMDDKVDGKEAIEYFEDMISADNALVPVKFELDSDGDLKEIELLAAGEPFGVHDDYIVGDTADGDELDDDDDLLYVDGEHYDLADDLVVFDLTSGTVEMSGNFGRDYYEVDDPDVADWDDIAGDEVVFTCVVDGDEVEAIYVLEYEGGDAITSDTLFGMVVGYTTVNDEDGTIILTPENEEVEYEGEVAKRRAFIAYEVDGDEIDLDEVIAYENTEADGQPTVSDLEDLEYIDDAVFGVVEEDDGDIIKMYTADDLDDTSNYKIADDAVRFFIDDGKIVDRADEEDFVLLIDTDDDGRAFDYVVIIADDVEEEDRAEWLNVEDNGGDDGGDNGNGDEPATATWDQEPEHLLGHVVGTISGDAVQIRLSADGVDTVVEDITSGEEFMIPFTVTPGTEITVEPLDADGNVIADAVVTTTAGI